MADKRFAACSISASVKVNVSLQRRHSILYGHGHWRGRPNRWDASSATSVFADAGPRRQWRTAQGVLTRLSRIPRDLLAISQSTEQPAVTHHGLATKKRRNWPAGDLHAFVGRVVTAVLQQGMGDRHLPFRIPEHDIGIRADRDRSFSRVETIALA